MDGHFLLCCNSSNTGRQSISPRLVRQCCILCMPSPSARSLFNIYQVQLGRFFENNEFNMDIKACLLSLVSSSIVIYYRIFINMLPTPAKSHYIFNLRDLNKLVAGLMQAYPQMVNKKEDLVHLFAHESIRVFNDRLVTADDNQIFFSHLNQTLGDYFKMNIQALRSHFKIDPQPPASIDQQASSNSLTTSASHKATSTLSKRSEQSDSTRLTVATSAGAGVGSGGGAGGGGVGGEAQQRVEDWEFLLYGDFIKNDERVYQPLNNWRQLVSILSDYQMKSSMSGYGSKRIVFFKEAVEHICRACRVIRQPSGHMLLIGVDGSGKSTIMELATYISNCDVFKLNVKKGYQYTDFREDLKIVFKLAGVQRKKIVFFIADKDIYEVIERNYRRYVKYKNKQSLNKKENEINLKEIFLEDISTLLTSGSIPDLFDHDELNSLFMDLKNDALNEGIADDKDELYRFLIKVSTL